MNMYGVTGTEDLGGNRYYIECVYDVYSDTPNGPTDNNDITYGTGSNCNLGFNDTSQDVAWYAQTGIWPETSGSSCVAAGGACQLTIPSPNQWTCFCGGQTYLTGSYTRSPTEIEQASAWDSLAINSFTYNSSTDNRWTYFPSSCNGQGDPGGNSSTSGLNPIVNCYLATTPFTFVPNVDEGSTVQVVDGYIATVNAYLNSLLATVTAELTSIESQLTAVVGQEQQDAQCAAAQAGNDPPSPEQGQTICGMVAPTLQTVGAASSAVALLVTEAFAPVQTAVNNAVDPAYGTGDGVNAAVQDQTQTGPSAPAAPDPGLPDAEAPSGIAHAPRTWMNGAVVTAFTPGSFTGSNHAAGASAIKALHQIGANTAQLFVLEGQESTTSSTITSNAYGAATLTNNDIGEAGCAMKTRFSARRLEPAIELPNNASRTNIDPQGSDTDPSSARGQWWQSYMAFMQRNVRRAIAMNATDLEIGVELNGMTVDPTYAAQDNQEWMQVISTVRHTTGQRYSCRYHRFYGGQVHWTGRITFGINWDTVSKVAQRPPSDFWRLLNYLGVDAYWPLAASNSTDSRNWAAAWQQAPSDGSSTISPFSQIQQLARHFAGVNGGAKRVVFTEIGYPNTNPAEQEAAIRGALRFWANQYLSHAAVWFHGFAFYNWQVFPSDAGTFGLRNTPAQNTICNYYQVAQSRCSNVPGPYAHVNTGTAWPAATSTQPDNSLLDTWEAPADGTADPSADLGEPLAPVDAQQDDRSPFDPSSPDLESQTPPREISTPVAPPSNP
jgi:hypothetical protein